ncbi:MAG: cytochrome c oxidase subunit II [Ignavibacteria bacterium]|jgi:cytochrome c oxidase subunit 2
MRPNITEQVDTTFFIIAGISLFLLILIAVSMIYFVVKYNKRKNPNPSNITGNTKLEILWTVIPTLLALGMFFSGYVGFKNMRNVPEDAFTIKVIGRMWVWDFEYDNGKKADTLYVPLSRSIKMEITSNDVNHSFFIPSFRVKEDAIPGRKNYLWFQPTAIGSYNIECAEYCGLNHSAMYSKVVVMPDKDFEIWYNTPNVVDSLSIEKKDSTVINK